MKAGGTVFAFATVLIRLVGAVSILAGIEYLVLAISYYAYTYSDGPDYGNWGSEWLYTAFAGGMALLIGFGLILFSKSLGRMTVRGLVDDSSGIQPNDLIHAGTVLIGISLLVATLPDLLSDIWKLYDAEPEYRRLSVYSENILSDSVKSFVALFLILQNGWLIRAFHWLRYGREERQGVEEKASDTR